MQSGQQGGYMSREMVTANDVASGTARTFAAWKSIGRIVIRGQRAKLAPDNSLVFLRSQTTVYEPFPISRKDRHDGYEGREYGDIMDGPGNPCDYGDA